MNRKYGRHTQSNSGAIALRYSFRDHKLMLRLDGTMSTGREIRSYDYVNRPYERVRDALR